MALYIAGVAFKNEEWKKAACDFQHQVMAEQAPEGYWTENFGPVVSYNMVYSEALGVYYYFSKDPAVPEALNRAVKFHGGVLWSDGTSASAIDERVIYHHSINTGNVGFSYSPEGRGFILSQLAKSASAGEEGRHRRRLRRQMLLYGGQGEIVPLPAEQAKGVSVLGNNDAVIVREKPWEWAFSAYATKPPQNRWIQDRHNLVEIFNAIWAWSSAAATPSSSRSGRHSPSATRVPDAPGRRGGSEFHPRGRPDLGRRKGDPHRTETRPR